MYAGKRTQKYGSDHKETVGSYHVTYGFQSEPTLCSRVTIKELLARNRRDI